MITRTHSLLAQNSLLLCLFTLDFETAPPLSCFSATEAAWGMFHEAKQNFLPRVLYIYLLPSTVCSLSSRHPVQPAGQYNMYNGNGMNLNVSMATNSSNMGQMGNQMTMSSGPGGGMANMGPEQVRHTQVRFWVMWHLCLWKVWMFIAFCEPIQAPLFPTVI